MELYNWTRSEEPKLELIKGAQRQEVDQVSVLTEERSLLSTFLPFCAVVTQDCLISKSSPKVEFGH